MNRKKAALTFGVVLLVGAVFLAITTQANDAVALVAIPGGILFLWGLS